MTETWLLAALWLGPALAASWPAGISISATSVALDYAVMLAAPISFLVLLSRWRPRSPASIQ